MGLAAHFQSTLYSWWFFMGGWLCALMLFSLLVRAWNAHFRTANGLIEEVHFHDIGKLCFAFTAFWGYLTFGQYLVIWYGNVGEETHWLRLRLTGELATAVASALAPVASLSPLSTKPHPTATLPSRPARRPGPVE